MELINFKNRENPKNAFDSEFCEEILLYFHCILFQNFWNVNILLVIKLPCFFLTWMSSQDWHGAALTWPSELVEPTLQRFLHLSEHSGTHLKRLWRLTLPLPQSARLRKQFNILRFFLSQFEMMCQVALGYVELNQTKPFYLSFNEKHLGAIFPK